MNCVNKFIWKAVVYVFLLVFLFYSISSFFSVQFCWAIKLYLFGMYARNTIVEHLVDLWWKWVRPTFYFRFVLFFVTYLRCYLKFVFLFLVLFDSLFTQRTYNKEVCVRGRLFFCLTVWLFRIPLVKDWQRTKKKNGVQFCERSQIKKIGE